MEIDLTNNNLMDEEFSNIRFLGIGKPSPRQQEKKADKLGKKLNKLENKIDRKAEKGLITSIGRDTVSGDTILPADIPSSDSPSTDQTYIPKEAPKFLGMPKTVGIIVTATLVLGFAIGGFILVKKITK